MLKSSRPEGLLILAITVLITSLSLPAYDFTREDDALMEEISHAAFLFFWNEVDPTTGLVRDKTGADVCSVASMGFGLAAYPIGVERGWVTHAEAEERTLRVLRVLDDSNARYEGVFCHFVDMATGDTTTSGYESVASTIDSALLATGALVAGEYFGGEAKTLADRIVGAMNWSAFVAPDSGQVYMAWRPDTWGVMDGPGSFDAQTWDWFSDETLLISILGISAPNPDFRLGAEAMTNWRRDRGQLGELDYIYSWPGTLFCHMWANCYIDFRTVGPDPGGVDWFFNTAMAVRANRDWCRANAEEFASFGQDRWGVTACSGPDDAYLVPGHQPRGAADDEPSGGVVPPYGAGMSVPFAAHDSLAALRHMRSLEIDGNPIWKDPAQGGYGLTDAFNIDENWVSGQVIGIAHGPMLLMLENARSGLVWDLFQNHEWIETGLSRAGFSEAFGRPSTQPSDEAYLRDLMADTWACIAHFVEPNTGLPFDTSVKPLPTPAELVVFGEAEPGGGESSGTSAEQTSSATNLGYHVACTAVAASLELIPREEAVARITAVFDAYELFQQWEGFSQSWNDIHTLEPAAGDTMVSVLDSANMLAGFIVAAQALPEVADQANSIIDSTNWSAVWDDSAGLLYGGYNMATGDIATAWHVGDYAGDGRMAHFLAIAEGVAPPESWSNLNRASSTMFGLDVYQPAWNGGGLFMQTQDGLFLDEMFTPAGRSAANFAYAQMIYAESLDLDAWGWSACFAPDGRYLGWGGLEVDVVTPHAAGMAVMYYPERAVECLQALETMGTRASWDEGGALHEFGFLDSVDLATGDISDLYIVNLDQAMLFLAVANTLEDGIVQRLFESHPTVKNGLNLLDEYSWPVDQSWLAELHRRDTEPIVVAPSVGSTGPSHIIIDDFNDDTPETNRLGGLNNAWTPDPEDTTTAVTLDADNEVRSGNSTGCLRIDYDVESPNPSFAGVTINLNGINGSGTDALSLWTRGSPMDIKIEIHGTGGSGATRLLGTDADEWQQITIPLRDFGGMVTDWSSLDRLVLVFEDHTSTPQVGSLWVDDIALIEAP